jgi:hypothetical protein
MPSQLNALLPVSNAKASSKYSKVQSELPTGQQVAESTNQPGELFTDHFQGVVDTGVSIGSWTGEFDLPPGRNAALEQLISHLDGAPPLSPEAVADLSAAFDDASSAGASDVQGKLDQLRYLLQRHAAPPAAFDGSEKNVETWEKFAFDRVEAVGNTVGLPEGKASALISFYGSKAFLMVQDALQTLNDPSISPELKASVRDELVQSLDQLTEEMVAAAEDLKDPSTKVAGRTQGEWHTDALNYLNSKAGSFALSPDDDLALRIKYLDKVDQVVAGAHLNDMTPDELTTTLEGLDREMKEEALFIATTHQVIDDAVTAAGEQGIFENFRNRVGDEAHRLVSEFAAGTIGKLKLEAELRRLAADLDINQKLG